MQKTKIDMSKYADMHTVRNIPGKDGVSIEVRDHIPYADKLQMAREMAENVLMVHDDSCMYESDAYNAVEKYMIAKYYTNIDTEDVSVYEVADFLINNALLGAVIEIIWPDFADVRGIYDRIKDSTIKTYDDDKGIAKAVRTSFGFLFNGEDLTESIAKAETASSTLMNAVEALRNAEKAKEENVNNGKMKIGGNIISFAKKE